MASEIERMFFDEIREKNKARSGAFHMRGKGKRHGFSGPIRTPYTMLQGKAKREYTKPGEVRSYFVYETFMPYDELTRLPEEEQKRLIESWRKHHDNKTIMKELGIDRNQFYRLMKKLDVPKKGRGGTRKIPNDDRIRLSKEEWAKEIEKVKNHELIDFERFQYLDPVAKRDLFLVINEHFKNEELEKGWGVDRNFLHQMRYRYITRPSKRIQKIEQERKKQEQAEKKQKEKAKPNAPKPEPNGGPDEPKPTNDPEAGAPINEHGIHGSLSGTYTASELQRKLEKYAKLLEGEKSRFKVRFEFHELYPSENEKTADRGRNDEILDVLSSLGHLLNS